MPLIDLKGKVEERPVPRLLMGLRGDAVTGVVDLREDSGQNSIIYVRDGSPVHAVLPNALDRLDQMLLEARLIGEADMARAQSVRETSGLLMGQVLCQLGLVADEQLSEVLRWQLKRKVTRLFSSQQGWFSFTSSNHRFGMTTASPGVAIDPRALVFPGILTTYSDGKLAGELGPLAGRLVRLRPIGSAQLGELGFGATHAPLLMHLRLAGFRLEEAWIHGALGPRPREAKAVMLALFYLDLLELDRSTAQRPAPTPTPAPTPAPAARILTPPPAPAHRTPTSVPQLDAPGLMALGQRYFAKGELNRAEEAFEAVFQLDPENRRVRAFLVWLVLWRKSGVERTAAIEPTARVIKDVLRADATFALGHYFVGELAKMQNDLTRAEIAFRMALSHDPNLIEAQRELRLMTMRKAHR
jgi:tetratricopeptide (TPR) repeat protein